MTDIKLPEGIQEYLEKNEIYPISLNGLDELVLKVKAHTGIDVDSSKIIITYILQEIRSQMLKGNSVFIQNFGNFSILSPENKTKKKVFAKFKPSKQLIEKLNKEE